LDPLDVWNTLRMGPPHGLTGQQQQGK